MKINVHAGHTKQSGKSPGAGSKKTGIYESVEDRKIAQAVIKKLKAKGDTVYDCTAEGSTMLDNLQKIVAKCNKHKVDLDVSIHLNCYNGNAKGTEVHIYSSVSKAKKYATKICSKLSDLGFVNRGVKYSPELYVLKHTNSPALLIETFFCDSAIDAAIYERYGYDRIAKQIANAIDPSDDVPVKKKAYTGELPKGTVGINMGTKADIKLWQKALNWFGTDVEVDGIFGKDTRSKTITCQKKIGVDPDGYVGVKTKAAFKLYKK